MAEILNPGNPSMTVDARYDGLTKEGFSKKLEKVIPEDQLPSPQSWKLGQTGMIFPFIVPAYQEEDADYKKIEKGSVRVIKLDGWNSQTSSK